VTRWTSCITGELTEHLAAVSRDDFAIRLKIDKEARTLTIEDNGCGMTKDELENNLGTIAKSGSFAFKNENEAKEDVDIIGQFGVGFYSAFMVSDCVTVVSRAFGADEAWKWESRGAEGYTIEECEKGQPRYRDRAEDQAGYRRGKIQRVPRAVPDSGDCEKVFRLHPLPDPHGHGKVPAQGGQRGRIRNLYRGGNPQTVWFRCGAKNKSEITPEEYNSF